MYTKGTHLCVATCNLYSAWNITLAMIASTHVCGSKVHHHDNHSHNDDCKVLIKPLNVCKVVHARQNPNNSTYII